MEISWTFDVQAKTSPGVEKTYIAKLRTKMKEWPKKSETFFLDLIENNKKGHRAGTTLVQMIASGPRARESKAFMSPPPGLKLAVTVTGSPSAYSLDSP